MYTVTNKRIPLCQLQTLDIETKSPLAMIYTPKCEASQIINLQVITWVITINAHRNDVTSLYFGALILARNPLYRSQLLFDEIFRPEMKFITSNV
jgi:hypothetical protein